MRRCSIRGFHLGIALAGSGHLVEDNLVERSRDCGICVSGEHNLVRRNRVLDTLGTSGLSKGIYANADVVDNVVSGVYAGFIGAPALGIGLVGAGSSARGNVVREVAGALSRSVGIHAISGPLIHQSITGNLVVNSSVLIPSDGILGNSPATTFCSGNWISGYNHPLTDCDPGPDPVYGAEP